MFSLSGVDYQELPEETVNEHRGQDGWWPGRYGADQLFVGAEVAGDCHGGR